VATMPFDILEALYKHSMTDAGLALFLADWKKVPPARLFAEARVGVEMPDMSMSPKWTSQPADVRS